MGDEQCQTAEDSRYPVGVFHFRHTTKTVSKVLETPEDVRTMLETARTFDKLQVLAVPLSSAPGCVTWSFLRAADISSIEVRDVTKEMFDEANQR